MTLSQSNQNKKSLEDLPNELAIMAQSRNSGGVVTSLYSARDALLTKFSWQGNEDKLPARILEVECCSVLEPRYAEDGLSESLFLRAMPIHK